MIRSCYLLSMVYVRPNMDKSANGQTSARRALPKLKDRFTGERLKVLRPEVYRQVVDLLAEPRAHVPYDHICRLLHVSEHTLKAIERAQAIPIAERKERLLAKALRIASKAADRIEDQIDGANITQATIAFGVATSRVNLWRGSNSTSCPSPKTSMLRCARSRLRLPRHCGKLPRRRPLMASFS